MSCNSVSKKELFAQRLGVQPSFAFLASLGYQSIDFFFPFFPVWKEEKVPFDHGIA